MEKLARREAFRSAFKKIANPKREEALEVSPPYFREMVSELNCSNCQDECIHSCDEKIIKKDEKGLIYLDFKESGCTFCSKCAMACPSDILSLDNSHTIKGKTEILVLECLAWKQTICYSCKDICLEDAIDFLGMFRPEINSKCTNCGFCVGVCPSDAISIKAL